MNHWKSVLAAVAAGVVGITIGAASSGSGATETHAHTVTKTVEVTPKSCLAALDDADRLIGLEARGLTYAGRALDAVSRMDLDGLYRQNANVKALTPLLVQARTAYDGDVESCRGSDA